MVESDAVSGDGAFDRDLVRGVVELDLVGPVGVGVDVVPGERWVATVPVGVGAGGVDGRALGAGRVRRLDVPEPLVEAADLLGGDGGDSRGSHAACEVGGAVSISAASRDGVEVAAWRSVGGADVHAKQPLGCCGTDPLDRRPAIAAPVDELADVAGGNPRRVWRSGRGRCRRRAGSPPPARHRRSRHARQATPAATRRHPAANTTTQAHITHYSRELGLTSATLAGRWGCRDAGGGWRVGVGL
jgi:hypothetical protein